MTNRKIAQMLEVSPATLSLIINNKPGISETTRGRVLEKMREMGFDYLVKPEATAAAANNLCFVVYKRNGKILDEHPFFLLLIESIEACARKHGYNILFHSVDRRGEVEEQIQRLASTNCDGVIICATEMEEEDIALFHGLKMPYVILDNDFPFLDIDSVSINNVLGTFQAVEHLVRMGHTRIGYLQSSTRVNNFDIRAAGFLRAMNQFHLKLEEKYVIQLNYTAEGSYQDFKKYLKEGIEFPTAFFSDDDTIAIGAVRALKEFGISVSEDISVIGFNDRPLCTQSKPAISSVRVPKYAFGAMAVELLIKRIKDSQLNRKEIPSCKYCVGTELVARDSVKMWKK